MPTFNNKDPKKEMQIWSPYEFNTFINQLEGDIFYSTLFSFLYLTGVRLGEMQALTWADFHNDKIIINKSITRKHTKEERKKGLKGYVESLTKNDTSNREIIIPNSLIEQLNMLHKISLYNSDKDLVFTLSGKIISEHGLRYKLDHITEATGLKRIRIHDFRHSHASLLLSRGVPIIEVSRRLGHAKPTQTLNTYGHLLPKSNDKILGVLDTVVLNTD